MSDVIFRDLHRAWLAARRNKKPSSSQARFELDWSLHLIELQERLQAGTWSPSPSA